VISATVMSDIPPSERVRDAWDSWSTDRRRAAIRAVLHGVLIKPLPPGANANVAGNSKNTALRRDRERRCCGSASNSTGACSNHPATEAAETSQAIVSAASCSGRWFGRAASCFVVRWRAGSTQQRGEHRDRCGVLNALRETVLGPGAPRIVCAGLPDRGAFLVAEGLPCAAARRARPVRLSRRRCPRGTGLRARRARDGTTPGAVTHRDRPGACARASVSRWPRSRGLVRVHPVMRAGPVTPTPPSGAWQSAGQGAGPAGSRACAGSGGPAGPLSAEGA
jgi:hypothetical protein